MKIDTTYLLCIISILLLFACGNDGQLNSFPLCLRIGNFKVCIPILSGLLSEEPQAECLKEEEEIDDRPGECLSYNVLDEPDRSNLVLGLANNCDNINPEQFEGKNGELSPAWKGAGWYRMILPGGRPGGSRIPEEIQDTRRCGTSVGGYISEAHPTTVGESKDVKFCFKGSNTDCEWETLGKVTHCGDYYVYFLKDVPFCRLRYCATN